MFLQEIEVGKYFMFGQEIYYLLSKHADSCRVVPLTLKLTNEFGSTTLPHYTNVQAGVLSLKFIPQEK